MATKVRDISICGGLFRSFTAWERQNGGILGHSTITTIDGQWYGRIGTRRLPDHLEALPPMTDERYNAVREWQQEQYDEAYILILSEHPWLEKVHYHKVMGEITV